VPILQLSDDTLMTESAAMMIYVADLYPAAGLAPAAPAPERAAYLRWMLYFASAVYMADLRYFYPARYSTDAAHAEAIKQRASEHMDRDFAIFCRSLGAGTFCFGRHFFGRRYLCCHAHQLGTRFASTACPPSQHQVTL
jgi:glutathione S-transferase